MNPYTAYLCPMCSAPHDESHDAILCCPPEVDEVWCCSECDATHGSFGAAAKCCAPDIEGITCPVCLRDAESSLEHACIQVAKHCQACKPVFTYEEQAEIEKYHVEHYKTMPPHVHGAGE